ncbi:hypothetical protein TNCT_290222 [Trichonephila clavata]|uniref:Uncharacterized protein n=1 Tax=Trichonephila clavata TaxID=2740835 RepID=A0A8X6FEU1_TRICU|nr:hypothetical protein TNCT_290222 [Trichonephila clavata]
MSSPFACSSLKIYIYICKDQRRYLNFSNMDDKMNEHSQLVCSDVIDHKKKISDEDGHFRDTANLPFPPSDGTEGHSKFYSKDPLTLSDDSETEYEDVEKGNKDGNVEKRKIDLVEKNETHVEKKHKIKLFVDSSSDDDSNKGVNRFVLSKNRKSDDVLSKNCEANDDDELHAFPETSQLCFVTKTFGRKKPAERG